MKKIKLGDILDVQAWRKFIREIFMQTRKRIRLTLGNFNYSIRRIQGEYFKTNIFFVGKFKQEFILKKGI